MLHTKNIYTVAILYHTIHHHYTVQALLWTSTPTTVYRSNATPASSTPPEWSCHKVSIGACANNCILLVYVVYSNTFTCIMFSSTIQQHIYRVYRFCRQSHSIY